MNSKSYPQTIFKVTSHSKDSLEVEAEPTGKKAIYGALWSISFLVGTTSLVMGFIIWLNIGPFTQAGILFFIVAGIGLLFNLINLWRVL